MAGEEFGERSTGLSRAFATARKSRALIDFEETDISRE